MKRTLPADCYMNCPRCSGTGVYSGYGTCFRCGGHRVVHNAKGRAELARREAEEARREIVAKKIAGYRAEIARVTAAEDWSDCPSLREAVDEYEELIEALAA